MKQLPTKKYNHTSWYTQVHKSNLFTGQKIDMAYRREAQRENLFIETVFDFYAKYKRAVLPWRKKITPYSILVSEIMLQQTQVARVLPKYKLWMKQYPTLRVLQKSDLKEVLTLWQGLGYQRRAKALLAIAQTTTRVPSSYKELLSLPGVGSYTASAIMAFAYNLFDGALVETNIRTAIIEHFFGRRKRVDDTDVLAVLQSLCGHVAVRDVGAREWYYALMDYGAHLKSKKISHNIRGANYRKQTSFRGSMRELRAKILFTVLHNKPLPKDPRNMSVLQDLTKEGFIVRTKDGYRIKKEQAH